MSSSESTSASESPPPSSPEASFHPGGPPSLERLVVHFVAAKRSLTSTTHVWRANELVTNSRALIEEIAVLNAKNAFARHGVDEQLETLQEIRDGIGGVGKSAAEEFKVTIAELDEANDRLQGTLGKLRMTVVNASLQRSSASAAETVGDDDEETESQEADAQETKRGTDKTLYDFIDEDRHTDVLDSLHALIDSYNDAKATLNEALRTFDDSLGTISDLMQEGTISSSGPQTKRTLYDSLTPAPTITQLFRGMEAHAAEMAGLLQSLISHYDLCVTALKHTEGGGEAAKRAIQQAGAALMKTAPGAEEESLYQKTVPEPISEGERMEMLRVLEGDAGQVEDVAMEMRDHFEGMEAQYEQLLRHTLDPRAGHKALRTALSHLHALETALPAHVTASRAFQADWQGIRSAVAGRTEDLVSLRSTFEEFLLSYASLLREVERRKVAESQMRKLAAKARRELERLFVADREAREEFMREVGGALPEDIWVGARKEGVRWVIRAVGR